MPFGQHGQERTCSFRGHASSGVLLGAGDQGLAQVDGVLAVRVVVVTPHARVHGHLHGQHLDTEAGLVVVLELGVETHAVEEIAQPHVLGA